jgi:hypothetical protein
MIKIICNSIKLKNNKIIIRNFSNNSKLSIPTNDLSRSTSFSMSGCGWLTPFYLGCIDRLITEQYLTEKSLVAGTSGGSLGALVAVSGVHPHDVLESMIEMSLNSSFKADIDQGLKDTLFKILPNDIVQRSNDRLHVVTTRIWPSPSLKPNIVSKFISKEHLIDVIGASCYIPLWSKSLGLYTKITDTPINHKYVDGGLTGLYPPVGQVLITPFPNELLKFLPVEAPNICIRDSTYPCSKLLYWTLNPATPTVLRDLYNQGQISTEIWMEKMEKNI